MLLTYVGSCNKINTAISSIQCYLVLLWLVSLFLLYLVFPISAWTCRLEYSMNRQYPPEAEQCTKIHGIL